MTDEMKNLVKTAIRADGVIRSNALYNLKYKHNVSEDQFFEEIARLDLGEEDSKRLVKEYLTGNLDFEPGLHVDELFKTNNPNIINAALAWNGEGLGHYSRQTFIDNLIKKLKIQDAVRTVTRLYTKYVGDPEILNQIHMPLRQELNQYIDDKFDELAPFIHLLDTDLCPDEAIEEYLDYLDDRAELVLFESAGKVLDKGLKIDEDFVKAVLENGADVHEAIIAGAAEAVSNDLRSLAGEEEQDANLAIAFTGRHLCERMGVFECDLSELEEITDTMLAPTAEVMAQRALCKYADRYEADLDNHLSFVSEEKKEEFLELFQEYKLERDEELER